MMIRPLFILTLCVVFIKLNATNVQITNLNYTEVDSTLTFDLSWENSWRSGTEFSDAVWIFVKQTPNGGPSWIHGNIGNPIVGSGYIANHNDEYGFFVKRAVDGLGTATTSVSVQVINPVGTYQDFKVFGIEMVLVPEGPFYLGDGVSDRTFFEGSDTLTSFFVTSEDSITAGTAPNQINGGGVGTGVQATYPKGYNSFYCMKYPFTQIQYVEFLNTLSRAQQDARTDTDLSGQLITNVYVMVDDPMPQAGNVIRCDPDIGYGPIEFYCDLDRDGIRNENNDALYRQLNNITQHDLMAIIDWAGLSPMTTMEYEKACRGPLPAVAYELAWGSATITDIGNLINEGQADEKYSNSGTDPGIMSTVSTTGGESAVRVGLNAPSINSSRELANASYYGIFDLSGRIGELVLQIGDKFIYKGEPGDGSLDVLGNSDIPYTNMQIKSYGISFDKGRVSSRNGNIVGDTRRNGDQGRGIKRN